MHIRFQKQKVKETPLKEHRYEQALCRCACCKSQVWCILISVPTIDEYLRNPDVPKEKEDPNVAEVDLGQVDYIDESNDVHDQLPYCAKSNLLIHCSEFIHCDDS